MAMARTGYSREMEGEDFARAKANEVDISPKQPGNFRSNRNRQLSPGLLARDGAFV